MPLVGAGAGRAEHLADASFSSSGKSSGGDLVESDELIAGLRYYILGVGLREELAKFLCFLPLLPWLRVAPATSWRRWSWPACVGIGLRDGGKRQLHRQHASARRTLGRLLMPAPLHMAMTGLIGLAAYRACVWPKAVRAAVRGDRLA